MGKCQFFNLLNLFFYSIERRFFVVEYRKGHFPMLYCRKQKDGKMAIFRPKPWINSFQKMSIFFDFFVLLFFIAQKGVLCFQNIVRDIFLCYIAEKKKHEKGQFLVQNHGLTSLEKYLFFDFLNFLLFWPRAAFFCSRIS